MALLPPIFFLFFTYGASKHQVTLKNGESSVPQQRDKTLMVGVTIEVFDCTKGVEGTGMYLISSHLSQIPMTRATGTAHNCSTGWIKTAPLFVLCCLLSFSKYWEVSWSLREYKTTTIIIIHSDKSDALILLIYLKSWLNA